MNIRTVLGIDPGSITTGYGIVEYRNHQTNHITHGCIKTGGKAMSNRLKVIFTQCLELVQFYKPDELAIETVFVSRNPASALKLGQARGAAICAAVSQNLEVYEYSPRQVKQALVGRGSAEKYQVAHMVTHLLSLDKMPQSDAADALGIALCHCHTNQTIYNMGLPYNDYA